MRALRMRRGQHPGIRPRGRPARFPISLTLDRAALRRLASSQRRRAEQTTRANTALQRRFDEQARELAEARARIAELEKVLAEALTRQTSGTPAEGAVRGDAQPSGGGPDGASGDDAPRPRPATPRPGIMEVRRQLSQTLTTNAALRALVAELQLQIATLERRCAELVQLLQQALSLPEERELLTSEQSWDADSAAHVQKRTAILATELEHVRRERTEIVEQRNRLTTLLATLTLSTSGAASGPTADYSDAKTDLFHQIRVELEERDRFAQWEGDHRPRETDRRLDPTRTLDEQVLVATIAVRWQHIDHAPHSFRHRPRWVVEGVLLDPSSEQFLIRQSRERVAYRQRIVAAAIATVT